MSSAAGFIVSVAFVASACVATSRTFVDSSRTATQQGRSWTRFSFAGSTKRIDARAACPGGIARITTGIPVWGAPIALLTIGIVTPVHIEVTCAAP